MEREVAAAAEISDRHTFDILNAWNLFIIIISFRTLLSVCTIACSNHQENIAQTITTDLSPFAIEIISSDFFWRWFLLNKKTLTRTEPICITMTWSEWGYGNERLSWKIAHV